MLDRSHSFSVIVVADVRGKIDAKNSWSVGEARFFSLDNLPTWKVVFGHHQIYASGMRGVDQELADKLTPLFSRYGVQLYLNGHEHHYERTKAIDGTTYVTCGNGATLRDVKKSEWTAYSVSRLGFAAVEVYSDRLEVMGIGTNGKIFDRGEILLG